MTGGRLTSWLNMTTGKYTTSFCAVPWDYDSCYNYGRASRISAGLHLFTLATPLALRLFNAERAE